MGKFCGRCGREIADDDFLCPACGAIWGDRIYRPPVAAETAVSFEEEPDMPEEQETPAAPAVPPRRTDSVQKASRIVPLIVILLGLVLTLSLIRANIFPEGTEVSSVPTTTTEHITIGQAPSVTSSTTPPVIIVTPDLPLVTYYVQFVDSYGNPIKGVRISNPDVFTSISYLASNEDGLIAVTTYTAIESIQIVHIPPGYADDLLNANVYFPDDQTVLTIVLHFEYEEG